MASNNMYRVGDFVYFETSAGAPYQIRKIEELNKTTTGAVEAKVVCFYRRRDLSNSLLQMADKANLDTQENLSVLSEEQLHLLKHRELFITRQLETLPATHIRGKARVTQFNENESVLNYNNTENAFFYSLVYDAAQKTIHSGKGSIRVGSNYQVKVQQWTGPNGLTYKSRTYETLMWQPNNKMSNEDIENFITICRSLGTYARACDLTSSVRQPNLAAAAAAAARDITLIEAFNRLHKANYNFHEAIVLLTPDGAPALVRDEMEDWSANEGKLFEEGLGKYGKYFHHIYNDFLPWKSPKKLVEFYYMWKTSQHYLQLKRIKRCENEHKLKQVYIPNYTKPNPAVLFTGSLSASNAQSNSGCESCGSLSSGQWFAWGPPNLHCKLCDTCWSYWKRYGGLKNPTRQDRQSKEFQNSSSPQSNNSATMFLHKSVTTHLYQCPQIGCDKHFRQAGQLHNHITTSHPELLESMELVDQNNLLLYEEFKNQKNGFFMKPGSDFKIGRKLFKEKLRINFRMSRCFDKENRMRLALRCLTKAELKSHLGEFIKNPVMELLKKKYLSRNFNNINNVIEKISKLSPGNKEILMNEAVNLKNTRVNNISSEKSVSSEHMMRPVNENDKRLYVNSGFSVPKRNTISNEALCLVPTFQVSKEIRNLRLKLGSSFLKKLSRKPFHQS